MGVDTVAQRYLNRELSWLDFNDRVLAQCRQADLPLLERIKFLAIHASNLDEFFQVRVSGLREQQDGLFSHLSPDGRTPSDQLIEIRQRVAVQVAEVDRLAEELMGQLADHGVVIVGWDDLEDDEQKAATEEFRGRIFPVLTPLAVDAGHPFPYISDLSMSLAVVVEIATGDRRFARIKIPEAVGGFVSLDGSRFVPTEDVIAAHLDELFPGYRVQSWSVFRITRNADLDIDLDEGAASLLSAVEVELRRRRFQSPVRLEVADDAPPEVIALLTDELGLSPNDVYTTRTLLGLGRLWQLHGLDLPELKQAPFKPVMPAGFAEGAVDLFSRIAERDILVHHPYHPFASTVEEFIRVAAEDPNVLAIKLTLYRTSGDGSIVDSLIRAAESGKQVAVVVELKARFDEAANIEWARRMEEMGVHVSYGLPELKVHAKACLVVRREDGRVRLYSHIGTGNYNSITARIYSDVGIFTADQNIGGDLIQVFNTLTGFGRAVDYSELVVAPDHMRPTLEELIRNETRFGPDGRILLKMNSLVDIGTIDLLYEASQAGVEIDLIVRGICCLVPGVPGMSDTIRVRSIVGRYLEHARIYRFTHGRGDGEPITLIGSADLMPRNLNSRVEVLAPVEDSRIADAIDELLQVNLADDALAWTLDTDGVWTRVNPEGQLDTHVELQRLVAQR